MNELLLISPAQALKVILGSSDSRHELISFMEQLYVQADTYNLI